MRLTHEQIKSVCAQEDRKDFVTCPVCGGHLHLFGADDFGCMGNRSNPPCDAPSVAAKLHAMLDSGEACRPNTEQAVISKKPAEAPSGKLTLAEYGIAKHLSAQLLQDWFGASEGPHPYYDQVECGVCLPYFDENGKEITQQWRWAMGKGGRQFLARKPTYLYGGHFLKLLEQMAANGRGRQDLLIVEGESNTHTLAQNGLPVLGLPGVRNWQQKWANLKCFEAAKRIFVFLDMRPDGKPEDVAILGARKIAESFEPGKVLAVKLQFKDVSDLWLWHMTEPFGEGQEGFRRDLQDALFSATPIIPKKEEIEGWPADLGEQVFNACPILKDFVALTLPETETDVNNLVCDFLACAGAAVGLKAYAQHLADRHPPATYHLLIGDTAIGKGTSFNCARLLFEMSLPVWRKCVRHSARSQQSLYRMLHEVSAEKITNEEEEQDEKANPDYTEGRLLLRFPEVSAVFKSMKAEWSTMSQGLREAYDGGPLSNERSEKATSTRVQDPYALAVLGDVTPWELTEVIDGVDFANGVANRFVWCVARRTKTIPHAERTPDYSALAERLKRVLPKEPVGQLLFSEAGRVAWDTWVYSLPLEDSGRLGSACGRMRANALRLAVLFAVLDESRLDSAERPKIEARHVQAAAAILDRHRETVAWFLSRPAAMPEVPTPEKNKLWRQAEKVRASLVNGEITDTQVHRLFSNHLTSEQRSAICTAAGLTSHPENDAKGNPVKVWR